MKRLQLIKKLLKERVLILDGAMGTMINSRSCKDVYIDLPEKKLIENIEKVKAIHRKYLEAGADIIETNSFNCNRHSLLKYGFHDQAYNLAKLAARTAKDEVKRFEAENALVKRFVGGAIGPSGLCLSNEASGIADEMTIAFKKQMEGLLDGGADLIMLETFFDSANLRAALNAVSLLEEEKGEEVPFTVACTLTDERGKLMSGEDVEDVYYMAERPGLLAFGINCGSGTANLHPVLRRLSERADTGIIAYPNAGLPDATGVYKEGTDLFVRNMLSYVEEGLVNIIGGCCGTTPQHINILARRANNFRPRIIRHAWKDLTQNNK